MVDSVWIRPAQPALNEGLIFARYLDLAADGLFRVLLGRRFDRIIGEAYLSAGHDMSYETAVFAERRRGIVGMASGYSGAQHRGWSDKPLKKAAGVHMIRLGVVSMLGRGLIAFLDSIPDGDFYLQALAVEREQQGRGIGSRLLEEVENRALDAGCTRLALDVAKTNSRARRLYESRGMTAVAESPPIALMPRSSVVRMIKPVSMTG